MEDSKLTEHNINRAIARLKGSNLRKNLKQVDSAQAHQVLPILWPYIEEIMLLADACKAHMLIAVE